MTISLPPMLAWLVATVLPLGAAWLLFQMALKPERCFGYNRAVLLLSPLLAAGLPLLPRPALPAGLWPTAASEVGAAGGVVMLPALDATGGVGNEAWAGWLWLAVLYGVGVALGLARLGWQLWQLRRTARELPREARDGYEVVYTGGRLPTSSFRRLIFWDETAELSAAEAESVLAHELAHVRQGHTYDVLWLELCRAVLWPNPFAHLLLPALRLTHELMADRAAATAAAPPTPLDSAEVPYPALLARLTAQRLTGPAYSSLLQPFTFSFTLTRIAMLQNQTPVRRWKQWLALPVLAGLFLVASRPASAQTAPPPPPPPTELKFTKPGEKSKAMDVDANGNKVYVYVEQMPELTTGGGNAGIVQAIQQNLVYPKADALVAPGTGKTSVQLQGRVFVSFIVDAEGTVRDPKIIKGLAPAYDAAVLTAVQKLPRFNPGRQSGKAVAVVFTVPIQFEVER